MNRANMWTILVSIGLVALPYLLTQSDVAVPPIAKVTIQLGILALGIIARYLPAEGSVQKIEMTTPVEVTPVAAKPAVDADA